jgi:translation initiation factor IF-2
MATSNNKNDNRVSFNLKKQMTKVETGVKDGIFVFTGPLSIEDFAKQVKKSTAEIVKHFFMHGRITNPNTILSENDIGELCLE